MKLTLIVVLMTVLYAQEMIEQALPQGGYRQLRKQNKPVPRFYICGAVVWRRKEMIPQPQKCEIVCIKKRKWYGKTYCSWQTKCQNLPPKLGWIRTNGIKFQYCHFQNWGNQISFEDTGNWEWQGMQMCPQNQYVYGMRTKLSDRDGLAGLILLCRSMANSKEVSEKLVFDGDGPWRDSIGSGNFAFGYKVKYRDGYINGLTFAMAAVPYIFAFNFKYQFPKNFNTAPMQIDNFIINNNGKTQMRKEISLTKEKQLQRTWINEKGYLHGIALSKTASQSVVTTTKIGTPFISQKRTAIQSESMTQAARQETMENFKFGTAQTYRVGQKQKDVIFVPACTRYAIRIVVYSTDVDVPYTIQMGYTNGIETEYEVVNGVYKGISTGQVETNINSENICQLGSA